jgi:hypothetical protein
MDNIQRDICLIKQSILRNDGKGMMWVYMYTARLICVNIVNWFAA